MDPNSPKVPVLNWYCVLALLTYVVYVVWYIIGNNSGSLLPKINLAESVALACLQLLFASIALFKPQRMIGKLLSVTMIVISVQMIVFAGIAKIIFRDCAPLSDSC